jgi:outer membrane protein TolC
MVIPIRNRAAQADNVRSRLEQDQLQLNMQKLNQQIELEVRQATISLTQGKAQVDAASEALRLTKELEEAEREKLQLGTSTTYNVILRQRDVSTARQAQISAYVTYAKALVDMNRATGSTLKENGIDLNDALKGEVSKRPTPPFQAKQTANGSPVKP